MRPSAWDPVCVRVSSPPHPVACLLVQPLGLVEGKARHQLCGQHPLGAQLANHRRHIEHRVALQQLLKSRGTGSLPLVVALQGQLTAHHLDGMFREKPFRQRVAQTQEGDEVPDVTVDALGDAWVLGEREMASDPAAMGPAHGTDVMNQRGHGWGRGIEVLKGARAGG